MNRFTHPNVPATSLQFRWEEVEAHLASPKSESWIKWRKKWLMIERLQINCQLILNKNK